VFHSLLAVHKISVTRQRLTSNRRLPAHRQELFLMPSHSR
jgi:hypothetical protein